MQPLKMETPINVTMMDMQVGIWLIYASKRIIECNCLIEVYLKYQNCIWKALGLTEHMNNNKKCGRSNW